MSRTITTTTNKCPKLPKEISSIVNKLDKANWKTNILTCLSKKSSMERYSQNLLSRSSQRSLSLGH